MEEVRKSYNPFKMWGSWVGPVAVLIYFILSLIRPLEIMNRVDRILCTLIALQCSGEFAIFAPFFFYGYLILGFFLGWGIHSLIRKYKQ